MRKRLLEMLLTLKDSGVPMSRECPINLSNPKVLENYETMLKELGFPEGKFSELEQSLFAHCRFFPAPSVVRDFAIEFCPKAQAEKTFEKFVCYIDEHGNRIMTVLHRLPAGSIEIEGRFYHPDAIDCEPEEPKKIQFKAQRDHAEKSIEEQIRALNLAKKVQG